MNVFLTYAAVFDMLKLRYFWTHHILDANVYRVAFFFLK